MLDGQDYHIDELPRGYVISNRYEIECLLGSGGMGSVHLAKDLLLEENAVAIKILHREYARDRDRTKRFLREVRLTRLVNHPNVVRTYDVGCDGDLIYFTMECVSGIPLNDFLSERDLDYERLGNLIIQICQGLEAIHQANIVHRDFKPANILVIDEKRIKITDFGVARPTSSVLTEHKEIMGSVDFMAPEILKGEPITPSVDFYSLGIILYELVCGRLPFESDLPATIMWMHLEKEPEPPSHLQKDIPLWLNDLILYLLGKSPTLRPSDAREIINFIKEYSSVQAKIPSRKLDKGQARGEDPTLDDSARDELTHEEPTHEELTQFFSGPVKKESAIQKISSSLRSACSGIIFSEFPTSEEIRDESKLFEEKRKSAFESSAKRQSTILSEDNDPELQEIRKLQRMILCAIIMVAGVVLIGTMYIAYELIKNSGGTSRLSSFRIPDSLSSFRLPWRNQQHYKYTPEPSSEPFSKLRQLKERISDLAGGEEVQDAISENPPSIELRDDRPWFKNYPKHLSTSDKTSTTPSEHARLIHPSPPPSLRAIYPIASEFDSSSRGYSLDELTQIGKLPLIPAQVQAYHEKEEIQAQLLTLETTLNVMETGDIKYRHTLESTLNAKLNSINRTLETAQSHYQTQVSQHRFWKKRLDSFSSKKLEEAIGRLSTLDKSISEKERRVQRLSNLYRKAARISSMNIESGKLRAEVTSLSNQLKTERLSLKKTAKIFIKERIASHMIEILNTRLLIEALSKEELQLRTQLQLVRQLQINGSSVAKIKEADILHQWDHLKHRLKEIEEKLPSEKEHLIRGRLLLS